MDININKVIPTFIEHEGFYYLEFEGEFYKGCKRCGGEGHFSFNGEHSRCYACDDTVAKLGEQLPSREAAEKWCHDRAVRKARREAQLAAEAQQARDMRDARVAKLLASDPEVHALLKDVYDKENEAYQTGDYSKIPNSKFLREMAHNLFAAAGSGLTVNMETALRRMIQKDQERKEAFAKKVAEGSISPVIEGRTEITGKVLSAKIVDSVYGTSYKVTVLDDRGFRIWTTLPSNLVQDAVDAFYEQVAANGDSSHDFGSGCWLLGTDDGKYIGVKDRRIQFSATVEASKDDKYFGFAKRPTKGVWL